MLQNRYSLETNRLVMLRHLRQCQLCALLLAGKLVRQELLDRHHHHHLYDRHHLHRLPHRCQTSLL
jgi:hypothetical protein